MNETNENSNCAVKSDVSECDPRVQMAAERTLLAWIRTGLALMAFGFVVARFALILQSLGIKKSPFFTINATVIGVLMVLLGVVATTGAPWHYRNYFKRIGVQVERPFAAWSLVVFVAYATALIGAMLAVYLLFVDIANWNLTPGINQIKPSS